MEGAVSHTLDLFVEYDLSITAEHYEGISHDLLSITGNLKDIKTIHSHPQALAQCRGWIMRKLPHARISETGSTSSAAEIAAGDPCAAAIAGSRAAHIYGLQVAASNIEDHAGNVTRFLVIGNEKPQRTGRDKTSVMFATSHVPGALFKAIEPVNRAGLNMVKLESRPNKSQNWSYYFFMDIEGHLSDHRVAETVARMQEHCLFLKHLGSYPVFSEHP
jgi:chorismate mutase/prephenate dehydratase